MITAELSASVRTIDRDIETLGAQGATIDGEAGVGFVMRPGFTLPPLMFRDEEIEALILGSRWVAQLPDAHLARAAADAVAKITAVLPARLRQRVDDAALFAVPRAPAAIDRIDAGDVEVMYQTRASALAERRDAGGDLVGRSIVLFITVADLDPIEAAVPAAAVVKPRHDTFYGSTELYVREPGGTLVGFAQFRKD